MRLDAGTIRVGRGEGSCQYREARRRLDEASRVLSDSQVILREDRMVKGEERLHAIGYLNRVLLVVHTVKEIISARKATPAERKLYEETD